MSKKFAVCYTDNLNNNKDMYQFLINLDKDGYDVEVYNDIIKGNVQPYDVIKKIDELTITKDDIVYFITDIKELLLLCFRLYHQIFDKFIYFEAKYDKLIKFDDEFNELTRCGISDDEQLYNSIYTNANKLDESYMRFYKPLEYLNQTDIKKEKENVQKLYYQQGKYILFEPVGSKEICVIKLDDSSVSIPLNKRNLQFCYYNNSELINDIIYNLGLVYKNKMKLEELLKNINEFQIYVDTIGELEKNANYTYMWLIGEDSNISDRLRIMAYSMLAYLDNNKEAVSDLLNVTLHSREFTMYNKYFMWNQVKRMFLNYNDVGSELSGTLYTELYKQVYNEFFSNHKSDLSKIYKNERNRDYIVVMPYSFLSERHAPTRTTLERVYTLGKLLGKKVLVINTRETITLLGYMALYKADVRNLFKEYNDLEYYTYKDYTFEFIQPDVEMPRIEAVDSIVSFIREIKPYFILSIGGGSILSDICSNIVPVLSMSVGFSGLPMTISKLSILGREIKKSEWPDLIEKGYDKDSIIESRFTFDLIDKHTTFTREQFGLPEDKFLILVVGIRLDSDVSEEFIQYMSKTYEFGTHLVFAGEFSKYNKYCDKYSDLSKHSTFIGYCNDMLALNEICNLYVNPLRSGGGFSIIEAFHEGRPGVTIGTGDVATAAGEEFCVKDYDEMIQVIKRYISDEEFYTNMAERAIERAKLMTDSKYAMEKIITKAEESKYFF